MLAKPGTVHGLNEKEVNEVADQTRGFSGNCELFF